MFSFLFYLFYFVSTYNKILIVAIFNYFLVFLFCFLHYLFSFVFCFIFYFIFAFSFGKIINFLLVPLVFKFES